MLFSLLFSGLEPRLTSPHAPSLFCTKSRLASSLSQKLGLYDFCHSSLDELPEFGSRNLETLRQPLEDRIVTISRASGSLTFPAILC